jgi:protease-4
MGAVSRFARRAGANAARGARELFARSALPRPGAPAWLALRLGPGLEDLPAPQLPLARASGTGLFPALAALDAAARDPWIAGVLLRFAGPIGGFARAASLRRAVDRMRESGRPVVAWAESYDAVSLVAASGASHLWLPPTGSLHLVGLRFEGVFLRGLLDRLELHPDVVRVGTHKTAGDRFTRQSMSSEEREQLEWLADDLYGELVNAIARGRALSADAVRELVDRGPWLGRAAVEAGLADACRYPDELEGEMQALAPATRREGPEADRVRQVDASLYHALRGGDPGWRPLLRELPRLAVVVGRGAIHRGAGHRGIASARMCECLDELRRESAVKGVLLRLESPGGDALASDLLWRSVSLLSREKPVVVSMGDVVASGAYYAAAAADAIYAEAGTLTGSIGVVGGKLDAEGLFRRLGVQLEAVERGARAGLLSATQGMSAAERAAVQASMQAIYGAFVERVAEGRKLSTEQVEKVAQGRVWSGARAQESGLVDSIGGPLEALGELRRRARLGDTERVVVELHPRVAPFAGLRTLLRWLPGLGETG